MLATYAYSSEEKPTDMNMHSTSLKHYYVRVITYANNMILWVLPNRR